MIYLDKKTSDFILKHEADNINDLALRASSFPDINIPFVVQQIAGRKIAKSKIPSWYKHSDLVYPKHLSLEQCSSESTALYKTKLLKKGRFIDLTGGMGVDFSFMAKLMTESTYIEAKKELVELAKYNFEKLAISNYKVIESDSTEYLLKTKDKFDTIYIDPARRNDTGRKTVFIQDCTPNLLEIDDILGKKSTRTIIKLSPMLDVTHALQSLKNIRQIHIVSVQNECKELLLVKEETDTNTEICCVNILNDNQHDVFKFTYQEEESARIEHSAAVLKYLYEPNSSIMKAGAYKSIAKQFNLKKLHPNSHLYTSDIYMDDFHGRKFKVRNVISPNKREVKEHLSNLPKANITTRNYPFSVAEIRKQTKLKEGGDDYIFATTLADEKKVLILCDKIEKEER